MPPQDQTVTHMRTIRMRLEDFGVDLNDVRAVQLLFDNASTFGTELYLDNLEFTGGPEAGEFSIGF